MLRACWYLYQGILLRYFSYLCVLLQYMKLREGGSYLIIWILLPSPFPPGANSPKLRLTSQLWEELHILLLGRALRVGCCARPRVAAAPWSTVAAGSNTALAGLKRACPAVDSVAVVVPSMRTEGMGCLGFFFFFFMLPPNFLQTAKRREKLSCITGRLQITNHGHSRKYQEREKGGGRGNISLNGRKEVGDGSQKVITARGKQGAGTGVGTRASAIPRGELYYYPPQFYWYN